MSRAKLSWIGLRLGVEIFNADRCFTAPHNPDWPSAPTPSFDDEGFLREHCRTAMNHTCAGAASVNNHTGDVDGPTKLDTCAGLARLARVAPTLMCFKGLDAASIDKLVGRFLF